MAATASPAAPTRTTAGVAPLRAGQGISFLLRRLHSLSGIVPVGAFLIEHFVSNAFATNGPAAYTKQVELLSGFPFVFFLELFFIWIPIAYHGLYGFYIWFRGEANVGDYPWTGNWLYLSQRWTGAIAFVYMTKQQVHFVERYLFYLRALGLVEPEEERHQWVFHVMVSARYVDWRKTQTMFPIAVPADVDTVFALTQ